MNILLIAIVLFIIIHVQVNVKRSMRDVGPILLKECFTELLVSTTHPFWVFT